jgi:hypothetical protein
MDKLIICFPMDIFSNPIQDNGKFTQGIDSICGKIQIFTKYEVA